MRKLALLTAAAALLAAGGLLLTANLAWASGPFFEVTILICNQEPPDIFVRSCDSTDVTECSNRTNEFVAGERCVLALEVLLESEGYDATQIDAYTQGKGQDIIYTLTREFTP